MVNNTSLLSNLSTPELLERVQKAEEELADMEASFDLRWKADQRATKRWQEAHPERQHVWPDHADKVVWLMGQHDTLKKQCEDKDTDWGAFFIKMKNEKDAEIIELKKQSIWGFYENKFPTYSDISGAHELSSPMTVDEANNLVKKIEIFYLLGNKMADKLFDIIEACPCTNQCDKCSPCHELRNSILKELQ